MNPRLNPIELLATRFDVVDNQNLFSLKEHEDIDGSDSMVLIVIELLPQLVLLEGQHFKPFVLFQRVSREREQIVHQRSCLRYHSHVRLLVRKEKFYQAVVRVSSKQPPEIRQLLFLRKVVVFELTKVVLDPLFFQFAFVNGLVLIYFVTGKRDIIW